MEDHPPTADIQLSENEEAVVRARKNTIFTLTDEVFDLLNNCKKNKDEILKRISQIFFTLRELSTISNNLILEPDLTIIGNEVLGIHAMFEQDERQKVIENRIEKFCVDANSASLHEKRDRHPGALHSRTVP